MQRGNQTSTNSQTDALAGLPDGFHTHRRHCLPALSPQKAGTGHDKDKSELGKGHEQNSQAQAEKLTPFASGEMPIQNHRGSWDGRVHCNPSIRKQRQGRHCKSDGSLVYELSSRPARATQTESVFKKQSKINNQPIKVNYTMVRMLEQQTLSNAGGSRKAGP